VNFDKKYIQPTIVFNPIIKSIRKNITDHICGRGRVAKASGYTIKAIPGPEK
jgi:hypothetical protein